MTVKIVHIVQTDDVGYTIFSTYSETPGAIYCFAGILEIEGGFSADMSVITEAGKPLPEAVERHAAKSLDFVFIETMKQVGELVKDLDSAD